jgi:hypothetical protein
MYKTAGSFSFTSLGTSNRTVGAALIGAGGSRPGAGGLARIYNYCQRTQPNNTLECVFGSSSTNLWVAGGMITNNETTFVTVLYTSKDGIKWTPVSKQPFDVNSSTNLTGVFCYGNIWLASVSSANNTSIAYSMDGYNWEPVKNNPFVTTQYIAYHAGTFVACGNSVNSKQSVSVSSDGIHWSGLSDTDPFNYPNNPNDTGANYVVYAQGLWWLCGSGNGTVLATSTNGTKWNAIPTPSEFIENVTTSQRIVNNGTVSVLLTVNGVGVIGLYVIDNNHTTSWKSIGISNFNCYSVVYANGVWVAFGDNGETYKTLYYSTAQNADPASWSSYTYDPFEVGFCSRVMYVAAKKMWVACGKSSAGNTLAYSMDNAKSWTPLTQSQDPFWGSNKNFVINMTFNGNQFEITGTDFALNQPIASSKDFLNWKIITPLSANIVVNAMSNLPGTVSTLTA